MPLVEHATSWSGTTISLQVQAALQSEWPSGLSWGFFYNLLHYSFEWSQTLVSTMSNIQYRNLHTFRLQIYVTWSCPILSEDTQYLATSSKDLNFQQTSCPVDVMDMCPEPVTEILVRGKLRTWMTTSRNPVVIALPGLEIYQVTDALFSIQQNAMCGP